MISPESEFLFRDSGLSGDRVSAELVQGLPLVLEEGGFGTIMISWVDEGRRDRASSQLGAAAEGCDAWVFHGSTDDPLTTAGGWLRHAPSLEELGERIDRWVEYYRSEGIGGVAYGAVVMRRRSDGDVWVRAASFPQAGIAPAGAHLERLFAAQDELAAINDAALLDRTVALVDRLSLEHALGREDGGWTTSTITLALQEGLGFRAGLDRTTTEIVRRLDPPRPLRAVLGDAAAELGVRSVGAGAGRSRVRAQAARAGLRRRAAGRSLTLGLASSAAWSSRRSPSIRPTSRTSSPRRRRTSSSAAVCSTRTRASGSGTSRSSRASGLPFHRHRTSYFYRCHAGSLTRVRFPDGTGAVYESVADEVHHHEIGEDDLVVHDLENAGDSLLAFTTVELL